MEAKRTVSLRPVISHPLEWPSLTIQWVPLSSSLLYTSSSSSSSSSSVLSLHKLVLGTHTSDDFPNFLLIADALLPSGSSDFNYDEKSENSVMPKVEITQKTVDGEVNKARCLPQNPAVIAAKTSNCEVYVFDSVKQVESGRGEDFHPDIRLRGHDKEGYRLSWSQFKQGYLLSGSHDSKICLWDISAACEDKTLDALHVLMKVLLEMFHGI